MAVDIGMGGEIATLEGAGEELSPSLDLSSAGEAREHTLEAGGAPAYA